MRRNAPQSWNWRNQGSQPPEDFGYVYIIDQRRDEGIIKIGYTCNLPRRFKELQGGQPHKIRLLLFWPCRSPRKVESSLHTIFTNERIEREWFNIGNVEHNIWHYGLIAEIALKTSLCRPVPINRDISFWLQKGHIPDKSPYWDNEEKIEDFYPQGLFVDFDYQVKSGAITFFGKFSEKLLQYYPWWSNS